MAYNYVDSSFEQVLKELQKFGAKYPPRSTQNFAPPSTWKSQNDFETWQFDVLGHMEAVHISTIVNDIQRSRKDGRVFQNKESAENRVKGVGEDNYFVFESGVPGVGGVAPIVWEEVHMTRAQTAQFLMMGQWVISSESTWAPARALAYQHGHRLLPEVLGLWEASYGLKKTADNMKYIIEMFSRRKSSSETMAEFCTSKRNLANKLRPTLLDSDASYRTGLEAAILQLLPEQYNEIVVRLIQNPPESTEKIIHELIEKERISGEQKGETQGRVFTARAASKKRAFPEMSSAQGSVEKEKNKKIAQLEAKLSEAKKSKSDQSVKMSELADVLSKFAKGGGGCPEIPQSFFRNNPAVPQLWKGRTHIPQLLVETPWAQPERW